MQMLQIKQGFCKASKINRDAISCSNKLKRAETNVIIKSFLTLCPMNYVIEQFLRHLSFQSFHHLIKFIGGDYRGVKLINYLTFRSANYEDLIMKKNIYVFVLTMQK